MSCQARNFLDDEKQIKEDLDVNSNDENLDWKYFQKYFQVTKFDEILQHRRNEYQTRKEYLEKRQETLHEREIQFKEKILSYEMYIKELAMKHDRSLRRIDDEKVILQIKQNEIEYLHNEIEKKQEKKIQLENLISHYQPHLNLLTQIVDRTDRFQSIDEMIEKFDILYASYEDILLTVKNSNEELNNLQRQLLLTIEKKNTKISLLNNRIHELEQTHQQIQQRIEKIQKTIQSYQQMSTKYFTDIGSMKIAIESMFDLVKKYSHNSRKKELNQTDENLLDKLKQIDIFLSDLVSYVDYINSRSKKTLAIERSIAHIDEKQQIVEDNHQWRMTCAIDQGEKLFKNNKQISTSYRIRGEDNRLYTIQINYMNQFKPSQTRLSLSTKQSSISMIKKKSSSANLQQSLEARSSLKFSNSDLTN